MDELECQAAQLRGLIDFARDVLKSVTLMNGGAAIALLAFVGSVLSNPEKNLSLDTALISWALGVFALGVFISGVGIFTGYFTQYNYYQVSIGKSPEYKPNCLHIVTLFLVGASLLSFFAGVILSIVAFAP